MPQTSAAATTADQDRRGRLAAFAFCLADLLFEVDEHLVVQFAAGAVEGLLGRTAGDLCGAPLESLLAGHAGSAQWQDALRKRLRGPGRHELGTLPLRAADGGVVPMAVSAIALEEGSGLSRVAMKRLPPAQAGDSEDTGGDRVERFAETAVHRLAEDADSALTVVSLPAEIADSLNGNARAALDREIQAQLDRQASDPSGAVRLGPGMFSVLHEATHSLDGMMDDLGACLSRIDPTLDPGTLSAGQVTGASLDGMSQGDLAHGLISTLNQMRRSDRDQLSLGALLDNLGDLVRRTASEIANYRRSVRDGSFEAVFHPIVHAVSGDIHHYEALCRFERTALDVSPHERIAFAEEAGLIHELDLAMVEKVAAWLGKLPINAPRYRVAVNISGRSLTSRSYVKGLRAILKANPQVAGRLLFEITESAKMEDLEAGNEVIQELRGRGCPVCLDDFGAGAASFQYLSNLSVDIVKLDGEATQRAARIEKGRAFLAALTELCRRLGTRTIAEMIDSPEMLSVARNCRVDFVQGFLFGRPSPRLGDFSPLPAGHLFGKGAKTPDNRSG